MLRRAPVFLLFFLVLSGCAQAPPVTPTETGPPPLVPPEADYGGVEGYVVGPDLLGLSNASVNAQGTNFSTLTDVDGYYALLPLPPGEYKLEANASGHQIIARAVSIGAGMSERADFTLPPIPAPEPYVDESFTRNGQIQCTFRANVKPASTNTNPSCSDLAKEQTGAYVPPTQGANLTLSPFVGGVLIEIEWQGSVPALHEKLCVAIRVSESDTWQQFEGPSILRVELGPTLLAELSQFAGRDYAATGGQLFFNLYPGEAASTDLLAAGGTFQQEYTMYVTVFYRQPPIPQFSRVAG